MAVFSYRAANLAGDLAEGTVEADSAQEAIRQLQRRRLRPIAVNAASPKGSQSGATSARLPLVTQAKAFLELGVLTRSGLPLDRALAVLLENMGTGPAQRVFADVQRRVKEGVPLSAAITAQGASFPPLVAPMVAAGEADGRIGNAIASLGAMLERSAKLRQAVVGAMVYPALLLTIATLVILMMLVFVVPQFEGLFDRQPDRLPASTKFILAASRGLRNHAMLILGVLAGTGFAIRVAALRPVVRRWRDRVGLTLPSLGPLLSRMEAARYARVLGGLLGSGVPMPNALALAHRTIGNSHMAGAVAAATIKVREGASLAAQIAATGLFPRVAISFIRTGEETAMLPLMLERLADVLDDEVAVALDRLIALLTPMITVLMGVIIATLIGSIMSAIIGFNSFALDS